MSTQPPFPSRTRIRRHAFTLLEVLAVVVLAAVLATLVTIRLGGTRQQADADRLVQQLIQIDNTARRHARQTGHSRQLIYDLRLGVVGLGSTPHSTANLTSPVQVAGHLKLGPLLLNEARIHDTVVAIPVSSMGLTPSYAIGFTTPQGTARWLLFCGLTGHHLEVTDDQFAQDILTLTLTPGSLATPPGSGAPAPGSGAAGSSE